MDLDPRRLFTTDSDAAFEHGASASLVEHRKRSMGNLLTADRAVYYVQLLYGMLRFRRRHELEPLHEDLFNAVQAAQNTVLPSQGLNGEVYDLDRFRDDIAALKGWGLIDERIELERLRGYRDSRRKKFRYSLHEETVAFLEWLEERLQDDFEERGADTRNLLETVCSSLRELSRVLYRYGTGRQEEGDARRTLFHLSNLDQYTHDISENLGTFIAHMYGFVLKTYTITEAKEIINELDNFVEQFLRQIFKLRSEIMELLGKLSGGQFSHNAGQAPLAASTGQSIPIPEHAVSGDTGKEELKEKRIREKILACVEEMEDERRRSPNLMRRIIDPATLMQIPSNLTEFYRKNGKLDKLCQRISDTSIKVWRKLHLHLRELERKSHRLEDLKARISEIAQLPADTVPGLFLFELIAPAQQYYDPQYWDEHERANPPLPRKENVTRDKPRHQPPLARKKRASGQVRTMEQKRLALLREWLLARVIAPSQASALLADGSFNSFQDLVHVIDLVKAGKLGRGKKLASIGYALREPGSTTSTIAITSTNASTNAGTTSSTTSSTTAGTTAGTTADANPDSSTSASASVDASAATNHTTNYALTLPALLVQREGDKSHG